MIRTVRYVWALEPPGLTILTVSAAGSPRFQERVRRDWHVRRGAPNTSTRSHPYGLVAYGLWFVC
eukprot:1098658-Prymnesium_polylepis.1